MKTLSAASLGLQPKNNANVTFGWSRDNNAQQTQTVTQGGGAVWGPADANVFTWDQSVWGGGRFVDRFLELEEGGEFRDVQFQVTHSANNQDIELHSIGAQITAGSLSTEN